MQIYSNKLLIDIGNSNIKWHQTNSSLDISFCQTKEFSLNKLPKYNNIDKVLVSNSNYDSRILQTLQNYYTDKFILAKSQKQYKKLINGYTDYKQLGSDRWLSLIACYNIYTNKDILLVDIGTVTTLDILLSNGKHLGGLIIPSIPILIKSFDKFSKYNKKIKNINYKVATDTNDAWQKGNFLMFLDTINLRYKELKNQYKKLKLLITGGEESAYIKNYINSDIQSNKNFVIEGLKWYENYNL